MSPLLIPMMMCNAAAAAISIKYGFGGPATTQVVACAAGAQAISDALRAIQWGYADAAVAGGAEGAVQETDRSRVRVGQGPVTERDRPAVLGRS